MLKATDRRGFGRTCLGLAATALAYPINNALAAELTNVDPAGPQAQALGYLEDVTKLDAEASAIIARGSNCANCQLYLGGSPRGGCQIFPGHSVNAAGWCRAWVKKPV
jgi:hypothetical protein